MQHFGCCQQWQRHQQLHSSNCVCESESHFGPAMRYARFGNFPDAVRYYYCSRDIIFFESKCCCC